MKYPQSIFIVGMPRSGSTLVESILSMNSDVQDLEEINILEESFEELRKNSEGITLAELYWQKVKTIKKNLKLLLINGYIIINTQALLRVKCLI